MFSFLVDSKAQSIPLALTSASGCSELTCLGRGWGLMGGLGGLRCQISFPAFLLGCGSCENTIRGCTLLSLTELLLRTVITTATTSYCQLNTSCVLGTGYQQYHLIEFSPGPCMPGSVSPTLQICRADTELEGKEPKSRNR